MDRPSYGTLFDGESGVWQRPRNHPWLCSHHAAVGECRRHPARSLREIGGAGPWGSTNPSCESRPAEPGASRYFVSKRNDSSIVDFDSRHRVRSSRWSELGGETEESRTTRASTPLTTERDVATHPSKTKAWVSAVPPHGGSSGRGQVCECVSRTAVPRSCAGALTGRGGSHDPTPSGLETRSSSPAPAKHT
jgi:hypothetical protein